MTSSLKLRIQHRETGCWLSVTNKNDMWVGFKDLAYATTFNTAQQAKEAAQFFGLTQQHYRITSATSRP